MPQTGSFSCAVAEEDAPPFAMLDGLRSSIIPVSEVYIEQQFAIAFGDGRALLSWTGEGTPCLCHSSRLAESNRYQILKG
jgi:hypothetical protein